MLSKQVLVEWMNGDKKALKTGKSNKQENRLTTRTNETKANRRGRKKEILYN